MMYPSLERETSEDGLPSRLNPDWVEWLMGWPIGWTDVEADEIDTSWSWDTDPADTGDIPCVTTRSELRAKRIKAIGNGQVPQAMAYAYEVLAAVFERVYEFREEK